MDQPARVNRPQGEEEVTEKPTEAPKLCKIFTLWEYKVRPRDPYGLVTCHFFVQELLGTVKKVPNLSGTKILHLRKSLYDLYACSVLVFWNSRYWMSLKFNAPLSCYLSRWMVVSVAPCTCARMLLCMHGWMWRAGDGIHAIFVKNQSWWIPKMSWSTSVSTAESSWLP